MTRRPTTPAGEISQVYAWLLAREEAAVLVPGGCLPWTPECASYTGNQERLAALRAGSPVDSYAGSLPRWARAGVSVTALTYARVDADGTLVLRQDGRQFAAENGL